METKSKTSYFCPITYAKLDFLGSDHIYINGKGKIDLPIYQCPKCQRFYTHLEGFPSSFIANFQGTMVYNSAKSVANSSGAKVTTQLSYVRIERKMNVTMPKTQIEKESTDSAASIKPGNPIPVLITASKRLACGHTKKDISHRIIPLNLKGSKSVTVRECKICHAFTISYGQYKFDPSAYKCLNLCDLPTIESEYYSKIEKKDKAKKMAHSIPSKASDSTAGK